LGDALVAGLGGQGVDTRFVRRLPRRTGLTFVVAGPRGEPAFLPYRHETADGAFGPEHVTTSMARARWIVVGSSALATAGLAAATARLLRAAGRAGAAVFVDLNVRPHREARRPEARQAVAKLASRAAVVKASEVDLRALGQRGPGYAWLERHAPAATWLVTRGAGPASAVGRHGRVTIAPGRVSCVDPTGAGDAFVAGALAALLAAGATPAVAAWSDADLWASVLRAGHMMGMKAVSRPGAVAGLVRLQRVRAALDALRAARSGRNVA
jgi:fructokinase